MQSDINDIAHLNLNEPTPKNVPGRVVWGPGGAESGFPVKGFKSTCACRC